jgi:hypothetical protein
MMPWWSSLIIHQSTHQEGHDQLAASIHDLLKLIVMAAQERPGAGDALKQLSYCQKHSAKERN